MMGPEIVAGAKAVEAVGNKALGESRDVQASLLEMAQGTPEMKSAAQSYARRIQIRQAVLTKIYEPLAKLLGIQREYFGGPFADDLAAKIVNIPDENVTPPPPSVALPAMQGLGWSLDEPDLKEMYLNLLATATDGRLPGVAHPSFADIIKQLSAEEAKALSVCLRAPGDARPIVQLRRQLADGTGFNIAVNHLSPSFDGIVRNRFTDSSEGVWINNWVRLGLITATYSEHLVKEGSYDWVEQRPETAMLRANLDSRRAEEEAQIAAVPAGEEPPPRTVPTLAIEQGIIHITEFGQRFFSAVVGDEAVILNSDSAPPI